LLDQRMLLKWVAAHISSVQCLPNRSSMSRY
jgi:hypothetical protein